MKQTEIFEAVVIFDIGESMTLYKPRVPLFKNDSVRLNGDWSNDSIQKYCVNQAKKLGYHCGMIQLTVIRENEEYSEQDLSFDI